MSKFAEELVLEHDLKVRGTDFPNEKAVAAVDEAITLLRHAVMRSHPHSPGSCSVCERIQEALTP